MIEKQSLAPAGEPPLPSSEAGRPAEDESTGRRRWLKRLGVAAAAMAGTAVAGRMAGVASADVSESTATTNATANYGVSGAPAGITPASPASGTYGVVGAADSTAAGTLTSSPPGTAGVLGGASSGTGVYGQSSTGFGVQGNSANIGIQGIGNNFGLVGASGSGQGLNGQSTTGIGLVGSSGAGQPGVYGTSASGPGVFGTSTGGGPAGLFNGSVQITGSLSVSGIKSAVVPHPDGSTRRLYCLESPESWFEDFGAARLVNGRAHVQLDSDFAAVVHSDSYFVYLTPEGDSKGLYIAAKSPTGFDVREQQGGTSTLQFSYRVVAKRRDIVGPRLDRVVLAKTPPRPNMPDVQLRKP